MRKIWLIAWAALIGALCTFCLAEKGGAAQALPVLSIRAENGSLDFVTKPVNHFVAQSIASWSWGYVMPPEPYYEKCTVTLRDGDKTILLEGAEAQVKVRGNWTTSYDKKPLRIKFAEKQNLLGMNNGAKLKSWVLLAEYKDLSMLRNKAALMMSREILGPDGLYAADARLVEVEINGNYWGIYLLTEQQQINKHRVAITEGKDGYEGTDIGYLVEYDCYFENEDELQRFRIGFADNAPLVPFDGNGGSGRTMRCLPENWRDPKKAVGFTIKNDIYSEEQRDFIAAFVENTYRIMYAAAYEKKALVFDEDFARISEDPSLTPREAVERVVDVQSLVDMYIISELTCDADIYWSSFYMDVDFGKDGAKKLRFEAPWDFDSAMGNKVRCIDGTGFYAANIVPDVNGFTDYGGEYETINPWLAVLVYEDWFQEMVREKWTRCYDEGVFDRTIAAIESDKVTYKNAFAKNYRRWSNMQNKSAFIGELAQEVRVCTTHEQAANQLLKWLKARVEFLNGQWHK